MAQKIASDVLLIRGSVDLTIAAVVYSAVNFSDEAPDVAEKDYATNGKYLGQSIREDAEEMTCTIRARSNQVAPPKFVAFAFTMPNSTSTATTWWITKRKLTGSQGGIQSYDVTVTECPSGTVVQS